MFQIDCVAIQAKAKALPLVPLGQVAVDAIADGPGVEAVTRFMDYVTTTWVKCWTILTGTVLSIMGTGRTTA